MGNGVESQMAEGGGEKDGNFSARDAPGEPHPDSKVDRGEQRIIDPTLQKHGQSEPHVLSRFSHSSSERSRR